MIKADLVDQVSKRSDLKKCDAQDVVDIILDSIMIAIKSGQKVELRGFGSFRQRASQPVLAHNLRTDESIHVPSRQVTYFKPGSSLIQAINRRDQSPTFKG